MENRFALVGAGGTGTILLEPLVRYLKSNLLPAHHPENADSPIQEPDWLLGVIDGDDFEKHNENRQLFEPHHSSFNKAEASVARVRAAVSGTQQHVAALPYYLGEDNIADTITDGTYVLIGVDSYRTRAIIEAHAATLDNVTVINGGNEMTDGSCQIWNRRNGANTTPPISFMHPEIHSGGADRSKMSCQQVAALPGGGQLIIANMMSATWMLAALHAVLTSEFPLWTDLSFDILAGKAAGMNATPLRGWQ